MLELSVSIARSPPRRSFLKNVLCNEWAFYSRDHFQAHAARSQTRGRTWERGPGSAGHALVYPRHMAAIHEGRFWAARARTWAEYVSWMGQNILPIKSTGAKKRKGLHSPPSCAARASTEQHKCRYINVIVLRNCTISFFGKGINLS
jgi:hypothetical protein